jgi:ABC-type transporter Mla subunit MlaD
VSEDVRGKLAEVRQMVEQARSMPVSASAVLNRAELLQRLDELGEALDAALSNAAEIVSDRESFVAGGRAEAERVQKERILAETEVLDDARRRADEVVEAARAEADELRRETDDYVDGRLANFEVVLSQVMEAVRRGRGRLAGRSTFDALTPEEADEITLPEHLEG